MTEQLTDIINETIEQHWAEFETRYNADVTHKARRKQNQPAQKDIRELTALGLIDAMPKHYGYDDAKAVLKATRQAGSSRIEGGFTIDGDGETWTVKTPTSKLYQYLNREALHRHELLVKVWASMDGWIGL